MGIVGAQLLYPDGRIQFGGTVRNRDAPEWFDHRYRFKPGDWGPAAQTSPALAVTGACMYVRREVIERVGLLDERYPMAYEDVDWCLRAWQAGLSRAATSRSPGSCTTSRSRAAPTRASASAPPSALFWERWAEFFDDRSVYAEDGDTAGPPATSGNGAGSGESEGEGARRLGRDPDGRLRIVYVTEDTGVGGGHRDIFEHLNRLADRGHDVSLYTLGDAPDWFELRAARAQLRGLRRARRRARAASTRSRSRRGG